MDLRPLSFSVRIGAEVSDAEWAAVSALFSSEYGFYSAAAPDRAGERIRLGTGYYRRAYADDRYRVVLCRDEDRLVAHAIYLERMTSRGQIAFVVQLVVAERYRCRGIASTLLHAIWGFSDYYAWGIVTSNAFTVRSLESATFRKASPSVLAARSGWWRDEVLSEVPFLAKSDWRVGSGVSVVDSGFYTDRSGKTDEAVASRLGKLNEGEEWLAVVFRDQAPDDFSAYRTLIDSSAEVVRDAYGRMPQNEQAWATKTEDEIDAILEAIPGLSKNACIVDFGAGSGRHVAELRKRGFGAVTGVDFSAKESELVQSGDCRSWRSGRPVDLALCLYDVVGSFPDDKDNEAIVANVAANLADGGYAVFSVSNWDFVDRREVRKIDFDDMDSAVREIFALEPSATMRTDGEFFDSRYILVDEKRHLVCHKEQFPAGAGLPPGEFLIRDRRFTADEISNWLRAAGLEVLQRRFVRAGFKVDYAVSTGKEILILARKVSS